VTEEALRLAEVIIAQSPVVLFRRKAGKKPTLVYVSSNLSQFGYSAEDLLNGRIRFMQIVHPDEPRSGVGHGRQRQLHASTKSAGSAAACPTRTTSPWW
jgi:hypothetical protein